MRIHPIFLGIGLVLSSVGPAAAGPGDPIGAAVTVVRRVTAEIERNTRTLAKGDDVHQAETIEVSNDGQGEIELADETKLALGPGAKLVLDKFVYDPDKTSGAIVLNMARGAFRFVTGLAKKPTYVIRTPAASITVRGTIFDAYVEESGAIWLMVHEGSVQACNARGECRVLDNPCRAVRFGGGGEIGEPGKWKSLRSDSDVAFETAFPFVVNPPGIDPEQRFPRDVVEAGTCDEPEDRQRKPRRAEPKYEPKDPPKHRAAAPREEPAPKKKYVKEKEPEPKKVRVVKEKEKPKKKYTESKSKDDTKTAVKVLGLAIGIGLAIGAGKGGGHKGGGYKGGNSGGGGY